MEEVSFILGGGVTGLAAGIASGLPVLEATEEPGGICSSYYMQPGGQQRLHARPADGEAYRFELGGGHWIFGGDPAVLRFLNDTAPMKRYSRRSSVYFRERDLHVPYPLQDNLRFLPRDLVAQSLAEMARPNASASTMQEWLGAYFGPTLCRLFFTPFHHLYTAGLCREIAPQDAYKSPVDLTRVIRGAFGEPTAAGYNVEFSYPVDGLDALTQRMADRADVRYAKRVVRLDPHKRELAFADGTGARYARLISTLPLNRMLDLTALTTEQAPDPSTAVLVLNIGAGRGPKCPDDHWLYNPDARAGFHRIGFYSNVDPSFLPRSAQAGGNRVSIYVERAYAGGTKPSDAELATYREAVVRELQQWDFIGDVDVVDATWIDVAYTWTRPGSAWRAQAMRRLEDSGIYPVGRYARWVFQGIADSIRDGFFVGAGFKERAP